MVSKGRFSGFFEKKKVSADSAGFLRRIGAFLIDIILLNLLIFSQFSDNIVSYNSSMDFAESVGRQASLPSDAYLMVFIMFILAWLYFVFFEYYLSQTPGQMIMKIKVVNIIRNGTKNSYDSNISLWNAAVRNCYMITFTPFWLFWILDPIYLAREGDRLLEKWTKTRTINIDASEARSRSLEYELKKV